MVDVFSTKLTFHEEGLSYRGRVKIPETLYGTREDSRFVAGRDVLAGLPALLDGGARRGFRSNRPVICFEIYYDEFRKNFITFGRDGKPFYQSGPYDNPRKVIETLEHAVGPPPAFDYLVAGRA